MEIVEVDGLRIAYERAGAGPPLVLLHGYVGDGPATWGPQVEGLADEFTVVAWDAPGMGGSSDPPEHFGMAGYADCLAGFIDRLGLERPHVGGLSFGGALALGLYQRHPTVPATLILASAYAGWGGSLAPPVVQERLRQALTLADLPPEQLVEALLPSMFSGAADDRSISRFARSMAAVHPAGLRALARACSEDLREVLPRIDVPVLLIYGKQDARASPAVARDLHAAIAGSTLVELPDTGHVCSVEAPEAFNEAIRRFLRGCCA